MGTLIKGDVVVMPFPFTDLRNYKKRPALVVSSLEGDDAIFCQITSVRTSRDDYSVEYAEGDFYTGDLPEDGNIRPNRLFTGDENIVIRKAGRFTQKKINEVMDKIGEIFEI